MYRIEWWDEYFGGFYGNNYDIYTSLDEAIEILQYAYKTGRVVNMKTGPIKFVTTK